MQPRSQSRRTRRPRAAKLTLSERMARIRKTNTKPEMIVRRLVHRQGFRYRLHRRDLPGTPDLVFPALRKIIFVHGCFWHRHDCKDGRKLPASRQEYWVPKLKNNVARHHRDVAKLRDLDWKVFVAWECQLANLSALERGILTFLRNT